MLLLRKSVYVKSCLCLSLKVRLIWYEWSYCLSLCSLHVRQELFIFNSLMIMKMIKIMMMMMVMMMMMMMSMITKTNVHCRYLFFLDHTQLHA